MCLPGSLLLNRFGIVRITELVKFIMMDQIHDFPFMLRTGRQRWLKICSIHSTTMVKRAMLQSDEARDQ